MRKAVAYGRSGIGGYNGCCQLNVQNERIEYLTFTIQNTKKTCTNDQIITKDMPAPSHPEGISFKGIYILLSKVWVERVEQRVG